MPLTAHPDHPHYQKWAQEAGLFRQWQARGYMTFERIEDDGTVVNMLRDELVRRHLENDRPPATMGLCVVLPVTP